MAASLEGRREMKGRTLGESLQPDLSRRLPLKAETTKIQGMPFLLTTLFLLPRNKNISGNYSVNVAIMFYFR